MKLEELDFHLPQELIARHPARQRQDARLLVVVPGQGKWKHQKFCQLQEHFRAGDLLVFNDTRVLPARLCLKKPTGGEVEGLFLSPCNVRFAKVMLSGGRLRPGVKLLWRDSPVFHLVEKLERGEWIVEKLLDVPWNQLLMGIGSTPLPPYIRRLRQQAAEDLDSEEDRQRYQTIWAQEDGSVAAPTASLHFDRTMLEELQKLGVQCATLTLHVGQGTFLPVETEMVEDHIMHAEEFSIPPVLVEAIEKTQKAGGRIIAAGTTVCRALEAWALGHRSSTQLMILPGFRFQVVDALLTNFHTPQSTLLALVGAMAQHLGAEHGLGFVKDVYAEAIRERYRFFSYGDASLWLPA